MVGCIVGHYCFSFLPYSDTDDELLFGMHVEINKDYPPVSVTVNRSVKTVPYNSPSNWYLYQR